jgi:hypothetical protein
MKLGKLKVEVNVITNLTTGEVIDGNYIASDVLSSDYEDISSIENWDKFGDLVIGSAYGMKDWIMMEAT